MSLFYLISRNDKGVFTQARPNGDEVSLATLKRRAMPTTALIPKELSQILGDGSKCVARVTKYQIR
jgi:hypothetical protein